VFSDALRMCRFPPWFTRQSEILYVELALWPDMTHRDTTDMDVAALHGSFCAELGRAVHPWTYRAALARYARCQQRLGT
jgi:hypothetical protein